MWAIKETTALLTEQHAYQSILAPTGIAPYTKRPLSTPSEMTAHHWINFIKVYGKYLLQVVFDGEHLEVVSQLLDFVSLCLSSTINKEVLESIEEESRKVAADFHRYFPVSERNIVMHLLVFHIPATLKYWGPARGYWCFPFER